MRPEDTGLSAALDRSLDKAKGFIGLKTDWYVGDKHLGTSDSQPMYSMGQRHIPYSILYVCQNCGVPWGRIVVNDERSRWAARMRHCPMCGPGVLGQYNDDVYELPQEAGMREIPLMRKCKDYEIYLITGGM